MRESWHEIFKRWICKHFGHRPEKSKWEHEGFLIGCCKRCRVVYTIKKLDNPKF